MLLCDSISAGASLFCNRVSIQCIFTHFSVALHCGSIEINIHLLSTVFCSATLSFMNYNLFNEIIKHRCCQFLKITVFLNQSHKFINLHCLSGYIRFVAVSSSDILCSRLLCSVSYSVIRQLNCLPGNRPSVKFSYRPFIRSSKSIPHNSPFRFWTSCPKAIKKGSYKSLDL